MLVPKNVKVGHENYSIAEKTNAEVITGGELCWGTCDYEHQEIDIAVDLNERRKRIVLLHEIIHAIDYNAGYTLQEEEVHMLAIGLFGVLEDNKQVREYIFGK